MLQQLRKYINSQNLFDTSDHLLLAVSGGVDSMVLTHLLLQTGYKIAVAHCNFHLRGEQSDGDESFVKTFCESHQIICHIAHFDTEAYATKHNCSIQMAARDLRYDFFQHLMEQHHYQYLVTAHHLNDTLESSLFYLAKGGGLRGISGIHPKNKHIVRPMLFANKTQILTYAEDNHIQWREDASNKTTKYSRNYIRHEIVPRLAKINPNLTSTFENTHQRLTDANNIVEAYYKQWHETYIQQTNSHTFLIDKKAITKEPGAFTLLHMFLRDFGFEYKQLLDLEGETLNLSGKQLLSPSHVLVVDRNAFMLSPRSTTSDNFEHPFSKSNTSISIPGGTLEVSLKNAKDIKLSKNAAIAHLDADCLGKQLLITQWKEGDSFIPLGMNGKKKLSDFFIDQKIPLLSKARILVVKSNEDIAWIVGMRIDNRFKVTSSTKNILQIEHKPFA